MRNTETLNTKGNTNVRSDTDTSERIFRSAEAEVIRDESKWDAFQLMGDTNSEEMNHIAAPPTTSKNLERSNSERRERFVNGRLRKLGGKITAVYNYSLR